MRARAILSGAAALALIAADEPMDVRATFAGLTEAALACAEATQTAQTNDQPITQRGWRSYAQAPDVAELATTYSREGGKVFIVVLKNQKQCSVNWPVETPSAPDDLFAIAESEVAGALSRVFHGRFEPLDGAAPEGGFAQRYRTGNSIGVLNLQPIHGTLSLQFVAMNRTNLDLAMRRGG